MASFYSRLAPVHRFEEVFDSASFADVPHDWLFVVIDIRDSTRWIEDGHYRDVTFVGAGAIAAVRNAASEREIPFVFGGDGATLLIPPEDRDEVGRALLGLERFARKDFGMDLHAGMLQVGTLAAEGLSTKVSRYKVTDGYIQSVFSGKGVFEAEHRIKDPEDGSVDRMDDLTPGEPDFTGLECRWKEVKGRRGEVISLLVEANELEDYLALLSAIDTIYGPETVRHPVLPGDLKASFDPARLGRLESKARRAVGRRALYTFRIWFQQFLLLFFIRLDLHVGGTAWREYLPKLAATTDIRKFDGMLRMVLTGTKQQRIDFQGWLEKAEWEKRLRFGLHVSDNALVTCLVYERLGEQVHFVDGANGGYTLAAKQLKAKAARQTNGS